jgi:exonuclease III
MDIRTIRIAEWNANGLLNHKLELMQFLPDNKIDVLLVSETHFTNGTVLKIPNYSIYHCNHPDSTAHGGAAILIHTSPQHYKVPAYQTDKIQAAITQIKAQPWSFNIAAMYSPPKHRIEVEDYTNILHHFGNKFMVGGDWNAKHINWGSRLITPKGRNLLQSITNYNCSYLST